MTAPPLETVSVRTKAPLGRSETDSLVDQEGVREAEAIVRRWANWIIDASSDMESDDHDAGKRTVRAERDTILQALAVMSPRIEQRDE